MDEVTRILHDGRGQIVQSSCNNEGYSNKATTAALWSMKERSKRIGDMMPKHMSAHVRTALHIRM